LSNFKPSHVSLKQRDKTTSMLLYIKKATAVLEKVKEGEELPPWVKKQIHQAASSLGMAVSYVTFTEDKKFEKEQK